MQIKKCTHTHTQDKIGKSPLEQVTQLECSENMRKKVGKSFCAIDCTNKLNKQSCIFLQPAEKKKKKKVVVASTYFFLNVFFFF